MTVKYTLETDIVKVYIDFLATPPDMREEGVRTKGEFMTKHDIKHHNSLANYSKIEGFWTAVRTANKKYKDYYNAQVDESLFERTRGVVGEKTVYNPKSREYEKKTYEIPPDVKAIELHKKIWDGYTEKIKHEGEITVLDMLNKAENKEDKSE